MVREIVRIGLRVAVGGLQQIRKAIWFVTRPSTYGVHAIALTPEGALVLVKLRYARDWRAPGGGRKESEDPRAAVLRELREEIGLYEHGEVRLASEAEERPDFKHDISSIFIVRDVRYRPRFSLEIEAVREARLDALPEGTSPRTRRWIEAARPYL